MKVIFSKVYPEAQLPTKATEGSAGFDLRSAVDIDVQAGCRVCIPTGLSFFKVPAGICGRIVARSGMALFDIF